MHPFKTILTCVGPLLIGGLVAGCGSTQASKFYALQPMPEVYTVPREGFGEGVLIGIGPVVTAPYLQRPQIAVVENSPEIYYSEFNRWAAPIGENISDVLAGNLGTLLSTCRVIRFGSEGRTPTTFWIACRINRFDGVPGGNALLDMTWTIHRADQPDLQRIRSAIIEQPTEARSYEALVLAQSALLADVSRRIAADIQALLQAEGPVPETLEPPPTAP